MSSTSLVILAYICCFASLCHAQHYQRQNYRFQRQRQDVQQEMPYPASGYRPTGRQFTLPQEQPQSTQGDYQSDFSNTAATLQPHRPELIYGAPENAPANAPAEVAREVPSEVPVEQQVPPTHQSSRLLQEPRQQHFLAYQTLRGKSQRLSAKSARLAVNSEAMPEDEGDDIASDVDAEVDVKTETASRAAVGNQQPTTVYYPAGAVSFVQPFTGPAYMQTAASVTPTAVQAPIGAQPGTTAYTLQYGNLQIQPIVPGAPGSVIGQPTAAKLQVQPLSVAKLADQSALVPASVPAPQTAAAVPFYTSPAAYASFLSASYPASAAPVAPVAAAYTATFAQPHFYVSGPAMASAQRLQTW